MMLEATIYLFSDGEWTTRTTTFPFKTEATLKKHLTSIYGKSKMEDVFWDIIEPEPEEGLEEIEIEPDTELGLYFKKKGIKKKVNK